MTWAIFTTPEDKANIERGFMESGLTGGEWNRIKDYALAFQTGWNANVIVPPEHPCYLTDGPNFFDPVLRKWIPVEGGNEQSGPWVPNPSPMRVIVMTHGTKAQWLGEMDRLLRRGQRDREVLRFFWEYISFVPWYAVDPWPAPAGFFDNMQCV